ncbi:MAG: hypothetical protein KDK90_26735, partial [Leptospiraceae bacterium]|nr:hypothetical protein [Leptospiraceae bacterium]
ALKGKKWDYQLKAVYCIGILDFEFESNDYLLEEEEEIPIMLLWDLIDISPTISLGFTCHNKDINNENNNI